jgi:hypothetical protein
MRPPSEWLTRASAFDIIVSMSGDNGKLPPPKLVFEHEHEDKPRSPSLEELLEEASRVQALAFGAGTLVGECLDTHNPHLPGRVLVRARTDDGALAHAWLPMLAQLRVRAGTRVLLCKPNNWAEPVVIGALTGLEPASESAIASEADRSSGDDPQLRLEPGQTLVITGPTGQPLIRVGAADNGEPHIELLGAGVSIDVDGCLRIGADRIELESRAGGIDLRTDGDAIVRGRVIRLN